MDIRIIEISSPEDAIPHIQQTGADPYAVRVLSRKSVIRGLALSGVDNRAANLIKQEMLGLGGDAAVAREVGSFKKGTSRVLVLGTPKQYQGLLGKLALQPFGLKDWKEKIALALEGYERCEFVVRCGAKKLRLGRAPVIMGILNVTPDSFSDGGSYFDPGAAVARALQLEAAGAGIIDIGGESTRPGAAEISAAEEKARVIPVIEKVAGRVKVPVSVDTYKPEVARAALEAGASIVNDISGLRFDKGAMAGVVSTYGAGVVIMHMRGRPRTMQKDPRYADVVSEIGDLFADRMAFAKSRGIDDEQVILDPGIGFGKTPAHNLEILRRLSEFRTFGRPLAIGTSRKSFIGKLLGGLAPQERLEGSIVSGIWAAFKGAHIVRAHDVTETVRALRVLAAIQG